MTNVKINYLTAFESYDSINEIGSMEFSGQDSNSYKWHICTKIQSQLKSTYEEYKVKIKDWIRTYGDTDVYDRDKEGNYRLDEEGKRIKITRAISGLATNYKDYLKEKKEFDEQEIPVKLSLGKLKIVVKGTQHGKYFEPLGWLLDDVKYEEIEEDKTLHEKLDKLLTLVKKK